MLLSVNGVSKSFGIDTILEDISFRVDRRDRIALVGRNGCGKTTLLRLLMELEEPDTGTIIFARGVRVSALKQEGQVSKGKTVLQEAEMARAEQLSLKQRLQFLEARLENSPTDEELEEYATLHEHFLELEGYRAENDVRIVLQKMGFLEEDFDKPTSKLSGGEKTRLALARLLLEEPDLLILDEPTNHLDLQATEWLEGWIKTYPGAIIVVSHDRTFLESGFDRFLELRNCRMHSYPGPLAKYLKVKDEEADRIAEVAKRQQDQIDKLDEYVRRFMGTQRTAQARGRLKMMEKLTASKVVVEKRDATMVGGYTAGKRSGDIVLECKGISKQFGDQPLLNNVDWAVRIGERWGVIGENGAGKSTLIKCALGLLEPTSGTGKLGANVDVGYFAQDVSELNLDQSPLDHLVYNFDIKPPEARHLLGRFLFYGDDVFRPI
ncbi:MAG: ABC-F family ATP-binding cassette domain-containing protein, partial [Fimbriimonadaceae bacterium]